MSAVQIDEYISGAAYGVHVVQSASWKHHGLHAVIGRGAAADVAAAAAARYASSRICSGVASSDTPTDWAPAAAAASASEKSRRRAGLAAANERAVATNSEGPSRPRPQQRRQLSKEASGPCGSSQAAAQMTASVRGAGSCGPFRKARMWVMSLRMRFGGGVHSESGDVQVEETSVADPEIGSGHVKGYFRAISKDIARSDFSFSFFRSICART